MVSLYELEKVYADPIEQNALTLSGVTASVQISVLSNHLEATESVSGLVHKTT